MGYALRRYLSSSRLNHLLLTYDREGEIAGAAVLDANPYARRKDLYLLGAVVERQGVGTALLGAAARLVPQDGALGASPVAGSEGFWERCGFHLTDSGMYELSGIALQRWRKGAVSERQL